MYTTPYNSRWTWWSYPKHGQHSTPCLLLGPLMPCILISLDSTPHRATWLDSSTQWQLANGGAKAPKHAGDGDLRWMIFRQNKGTTEVGATGTLFACVSDGKRGKKTTLHVNQTNADEQLAKIWSSAVKGRPRGAPYSTSWGRSPQRELWQGTSVGSWRPHFRG